MTVPGAPLIVGIGPGDPDSIPASVFRAVVDRDAPILAVDLSSEVIVALGVAVEIYDRALPIPNGAVVVAADPIAQRLAISYPGAHTVPSREVLRSRAIGAQVAELARVGLRLRRECPWDQKQTPESIVPHTVEEAFEVAEAVGSGDPAHLADELGDLLFQSVFLAQFLEEESQGDLGTVAKQQADKLISRHPHIYGDAVAEEAGAVVDLWDQRKRAEREGQGIFHELPVGLPALHFAAKVQKRAASVGFRWREVEPALAKLEEEVAELREEPNAHELGDVLFAAIGAAREIDVDPELALRAAAQRFRQRVQTAADLAQESGVDFEQLDVSAQLDWYARAREVVA